MRLLDLFCGAGGAAVGYHRAGFTEIVGVDIKPQPRYPFTFVLGDALEYVRAHGREFDAIHASSLLLGSDERANRRRTQSDGVRIELGCRRRKRSHGDDRRLAVLKRAHRLAVNQLLVALLTDKPPDGIAEQKVPVLIANHNFARDESAATPMLQFSVGHLSSLTIVIPFIRVRLIHGDDVHPSQMAPRHSQLQHAADGPDWGDGIEAGDIVEDVTTYMRGQRRARPKPTQPITPNGW